MSDLSNLESKKLLVKSFVSLFNSILLVLVYLAVLDTLVLVLFIYILVLSFVYYLMCYRVNFIPTKFLFEVYQSNDKIYEVNSSAELSKSIKIISKSLVYSFILILIIIRLNY